YRACQPLMNDLAAVGQANGADDFVVVRKHECPLLLVPKSAEEIVEVAGEQGRGVGGEAAGEIGGADDGDSVPHHPLAADAAFDIAAGVGGKVDDDAARPHGRDL